MEVAAALDAVRTSEPRPRPLASHEASSQPGAFVAANVDRIGTGTSHVPAETDRLFRALSTCAATNFKCNHPGDGTTGRRSVEALSQ